MKTIIDIRPLGFPWETQDPFLFCAYHKDDYPQGSDSMGVNEKEVIGRIIGQDFILKDGWRMYHGHRIPGFPYHPHRGFETITINKEGVVDHLDSMGGAGRFKEGDVQWMTAGRGVQHSEMFPLLAQNRRNPLEIFQIWLNLPKRSKMVPPHYKMLWKESIPKISHTDKMGRRSSIDLIAGSLGRDQAPSPTPDSWAADETNGVRILTIDMEPNAEWLLEGVSTEYNRSIFYHEGNTLSIDGLNIRSEHNIQARADADLHIVNGEQQSKLLILEGRPINEPVVKHGPFVMNTEEEIRDTMKEYGKTQFGGWPWPQREMAHPREKGRFAIHSDGREENPG